MTRHSRQFRVSTPRSVREQRHRPSSLSAEQHGAGDRRRSEALPYLIEGSVECILVSAVDRQCELDGVGVLEIAQGYLELVPAGAARDRLFARVGEEHDAAVAAVLAIVEADELLDRHPVLQRSVRLRNPYVDPMNAIQVELLRRYRSAPDDAVREQVRRPLLRSIAGIAAALRNTG